MKWKHAEKIKPDLKTILKEKCITGIPTTVGLFTCWLVGNLVSFEFWCSFWRDPSSFSFWWSNSQKGIYNSLRMNPDELGNTAFPFWLSLLSNSTIHSCLGKVDTCSRDSASWDWNIFGLSDPSNSFTGLSKVFDLPNRFVVCISWVLNTTIWLTIGVWGMFKASSRLTVDKVLFIEAFSICSSRSIWRALKTISCCVLGSYYFWFINVQLFHCIKLLFGVAIFCCVLSMLSISLTLFDFWFFYLPEKIEIAKAFSL